MTFKIRDVAAEKILNQVHDGKDVLVVGNGWSIKLLERYLTSLIYLHYPGQVLILQEAPALRAYFDNGGSLSVVDYSANKERGQQFIGEQTVFDQLVLAEDNIGSMVSVMKDVLVPIMERQDTTKLLVLGDISAHSSDD